MLNVSFPSPERKSHLLIDISLLHLAVELGQLDRKNDTGDEEEYAPAHTEPKGILNRGR